MKKNWLAVASAEHARLGRQNSFMQVCHGKAAPLRRIKPEDSVVYYSPNVTWFESNETPISPLLDVLDFTSGIKNWGYQLRFGLLIISEHDMHIISQAMGISQFF